MKDRVFRAGLPGRRIGCNSFAHATIHSPERFRS